MALDFFTDTNNWMEELFHVKKPIIAMCHLLPLPGDPYYDEEKGLEAIIDRAKADVRALQEGGVDGIMFSNEYSLPYLTKMEPITLAAMAYVIGRVKEDWAEALTHTVTHDHIFCDGSCLLDVSRRAG